MKTSTFRIIQLATLTEVAFRKHLLLAFDGFLYFVLALLDVLAHVAAQSSYTAFKAFDITIGMKNAFCTPTSIKTKLSGPIGAVSAGPLFMFTLYLAILTTQDLQSILPHRIRWITKYTLFTCIPLIVISNALGSFLGLRYGEQASV